MLAFARRSATVGTYIPVLISIMLIIIIIVPMLNIIAGVVSTAYRTDGRLIAICVMIAFDRSGSTVGACQPMLIGIIFIAVIILVINIAAGVVNAAYKTDGWFIAICGMSPFFGSNAAVGTYIPVLISVMLIIIIIVPMMNIVTEIINAAFCTDAWFIAICIMRYFLRSSAATGAYPPMLISIVLEGIIVILVLNTTAGVISATYCTDTGIVAICPMLFCVNRSITTGTYLPMLIDIMLITAVIFMTNIVARIVNTTSRTDIGSVTICPMISCVNSSIAFKAFEPMTIVI